MLANIPKFGVVFHSAHGVPEIRARCVIAATNQQRVQSGRYSSLVHIFIAHLRMARATSEKRARSIGSHDSHTITARGGRALIDS